MAPHLIRMDGDVQGKAYPIKKAVLLIGRTDDADITLQSRYASRTHAELHYADGIYTLYVPEGKQVLLNGQQVTGQNRINPGDYIDFPEERFLFGEVKVELTSGKKEVAKIDPIRILIYLLPVAGIIAFIYMSLNAPTYATPPPEAPFDVTDLKVLTSENPELDNLAKDIFFRGDYISAMRRLDTEVGSSVTSEERQNIKNVIMGLVKREIANQFADGRDHFQTQQYEAARTNFNHIIRLEVIFDAETKKTNLPNHHRFTDIDGNYETYTVEDALTEARDGIQRCDAILEGRKDPGAGGKRAEAEPAG